MKRKHKNYQVDEVLASLRRKRDVRISAHSNLITINIGERRVGDIGNGTRGKIDFLKNHCKYMVMYQDLD